MGQDIFKITKSYSFRYEIDFSCRTRNRPVSSLGLNQKNFI